MSFCSFLTAYSLMTSVPVAGLTSTGLMNCEPCLQGQPITAAAVVAEPAPASGRVPWTGIIGVEGTPTGDGRLIETNALVWDTLPLPLRYAPVDAGEHDGAVVVGQIDSISRASGGQLTSTGTLDLGSPYGAEAMRAVQEKLQDGVSMDLDDVSFELRVKQELMQGGEEGLLGLLFGEPADTGPADAQGRVTVATINSGDEMMVTTSARIRAATLVSIPAFNEARIALASGPAPSTGPADSPGIPGEGDGPPMPGVLHGPNGDTECSCTEGDPGYDPDCDCSMPMAAPPFPGKKAPAPAPGGMMPDGKTPCSTDKNDPAFNPGCVAAKTPPAASPSGKKAPAKGGKPFPPSKNAALTLAASAAPEAPPVSWFSRPNFREPTALTVTPEGRVYGHLAAWNTCHISHTHSGCVTPPRSAAGYAYFHTGTVLTAEGAEVPVGHITLDTKHAGTSLTAVSAAAHYEYTGSVVADVAAGEDSHGIWVAGALRPAATPTQIRALRSAPLSGDWRRISGNLELVAALAVNVPGFPVPRPHGLVAGGVAQTLVASGMLPPRRVRRPDTPGALSVDDLRYLKRLADRERTEDKKRPDAATALARRVRASSLAVRAHRPLDMATTTKEN